jgi:hypothetical protein
MSSDFHADKEQGKFREMCALAVSGGLTAEELAELKSHLEKCEVCREVLSQYRTLGAQGLASLAESYSEHHESSSWDHSASWKKLLARLRADQAPEVKPVESSGDSRQGWLRRIRTDWFKRGRSKKPSATSK